MKKAWVRILATIVFALGLFYFTLPALNLKSPDFYTYIIAVTVVYFLLSTAGKLNLDDIRMRTVDLKGLKLNSKISLGIVALAALVLLVGHVISHQFFRASDYQQMMRVEQREFVEDVGQISLSDVPIVDRDSAVRLGNRKLGELVNLVSQFEVDELGYSYTQINYRGTPTRVAPLVYGDVIKWFNNQSQGIPGYISVNMTNQDVTLVQLESGIKYSPSEYFFRDLDRHLRLQYPTYIFDTYSFEVDDDSNPYWVCPVVDYTIGLFGGRDVVGVVLADACSGGSTYYPIDQAPTWIDRGYSADIINEQINYWGKYRNGFINTILGQRDMVITSGGYNYLALEDDVWLYTGLTSAGQDSSNIGFVLVNMRTKESRYYEVSGATEYSAMASAEGQVQNLAYVATFPVLLNISNQPTYLVSLKDNAGLVKKFAYVNVERYQMVGIGDSLQDAYADYVKLLGQAEVVDTTAIQNVTGKLTAVSTAVLEGNTNYYLQVEGSDKVFMAPIQLNNALAILKEGDQVTISFIDTGAQFIDIYTLEN